MKQKKQNVKQAAATTTVLVHQGKSTLFRVIHAEGVWLSMVNRRSLHLTFFSERQPIPTSLTLNLDENGTVTGEAVEKRQGKKGIYREMEADVVLSHEAAKHLYSTLGQYLVGG